MTAAPEITPVAVAVAVLTVFMGPELAAVFAAYAIILLGWLGGVMVGVYRMPPGSRLRLVAFVLVSLVAVLGMTVPLAQAAATALVQFAPWLTVTEAKGLLFPVAFALPAIGHNWFDIAGWAVGLVRRRFQPKGEGQQ